MRAPSTVHLSRILRAAGVLALAVAPAARGQTAGAIVGLVTDAVSGRPLQGAVVELDRGLRAAVTDADGRYRLAEVRPGRYRVTARAVGYRPLGRDSVSVTGGRTLTLHIALAPEAVQLPGVTVVAPPDPLLNPQVTATVQPITAAELRGLPLTSLDEAVALKAGVVGGSIRGGRVGQDVLVLDGFQLKNQLDAAAGAMGLTIPPVALEEAALVSHGFSARYGQALSGVVTAVTREGGSRLAGSAAFESDRPLPDGWDYGLDRLVLAAGGPAVGRGRFFAALDARARLDDDPVNAPAPTDPRDPRSARPWLLPHAGGERYDLLAKLTLPVGDRYTVRLLGAASEHQRQLFDPGLKYADRSLAEALSGRLATAHVQHVARPHPSRTTIVDLRLGWFEKEAIRAPLLAMPDYRFGAFTFSGFEFAGTALARARDSAAAASAIPGVAAPEHAANTPWGVPAFFYTASPRGEVLWNRFRDGRARLDVFLGRGPDTELRAGLEYVRQRVETFGRLEAYRPVAGGAPVPQVAAFGPFQAAGYGEVHQRLEDLAFTLGLRVDAFSPRSGLDGASPATKLAFGPRFAVSTVLANAVVVASWGRFAQPPDFQYLTDVAFSDSLRTGRLRRGNPGLGFETSTQYEFQVRARPSPVTGVRVGAYIRRLDGLVASVPLGLDPDSAVFGNADFGDVRGVELTVERDVVGGFGGRATYVLQDAKATATDALDFYRRFRIAPNGDTIMPAAVTIPLDFDRRHSVILVGQARSPRTAGPVLRGFELGAVARWASGLPYSRTTAAGDSLLGLPNAYRLPWQFAVDLLMRRTVRLRGLGLALYVDVRNVTNRRNVVAVRRDSGQPAAGEAAIAEAAQAAYVAHPEPIPYESPRYRAWADLNGDGFVTGAGELVPLYEGAARDYLHPTFAYGPPRLVRLGIEVTF